MDDILLPSWIASSASMAMATALGRALGEEYDMLSAMPPTSCALLDEDDTSAETSSSSSISGGSHRSDSEVSGEASPNEFVQRGGSSDSPYVLSERPPEPQALPEVASMQPRPHSGPPTVPLAWMSPGGRPGMSTRPAMGLVGGGMSAASTTAAVAMGGVGRGNTGSSAAMANSFAEPSSIASTPRDATRNQLQQMSAARCGGGGEVLQHTAVQRLLRLSCMNEIACGEQTTIRAHEAAAMVAFMTLAVTCRTLPCTTTKAFYTECSSLYASVLAKLPQLRYSAEVDVEGFVAVFVACGLKLRQGVEADATLPATRATRSPLTTLGVSSSGGPSTVASARLGLDFNNLGTPRHGPIKRAGLAGFDARIMEPVLLACLPGDLARCVRDAVAVGTLAGLSCSRARQSVFFSNSLLTHLYRLADAFVVSPHRQEGAYKRFFTLLLDALSCSDQVDPTRAARWESSILRHDYLIRGLFQRDLLHPRVVAASLTLLSRQHRRLVDGLLAALEDAEPSSRSLSMASPPPPRPDEAMVAAEKAMGGSLAVVWMALQDALRSRGGGADAAATSRQRTLYAANLLLLVTALLRGEVERVAECARVRIAYAALLRVNEPVASHGQRQVALPDMPNGLSSAKIIMHPAVYRRDTSHDNDDEEEEDEEDLQSEGARDKVCGAARQATRQDTFALCRLGALEERRRQDVLEHLVRLALSPTSLLHGLPSSEAATALRRTVLGCLTTTLTLCTATACWTAPRARDPLPRYHTTTVDDVTEDGVLLRCSFSDGFVRGVQDVLRMLIHHVTPAPGAALGVMGADDRAVAGMCVLSLCANNSSLRDFAVAELIDAVARLSIGPAQHVDASTATGGSEADGVLGLALSLNLLSRLVVTMPSMRGLVLVTAQPGACYGQELARHGRMLCEMYTEALRTTLVACGGVDKMKTTTVNATSPDGSNPAACLLLTPRMRVIAKELTRLAERVQRRLQLLAGMTARLCARLQEQSSGSEAALLDEQAKVNARRAARRTINAEQGPILALMQAVMRCVTRVAWPGAGVVYERTMTAVLQKDRPTRALPATLSPLEMAPVVLAVIAPLFEPLRILLHLSTLFPVRRLRNFARHYRYGAAMLVEDNSDAFMPCYFPQPDLGEDGGATAPGRYHESMFSSLWLMLTFYGFTSQALVLFLQSKRAHKSPFAAVITAIRRGDADDKSAQPLSETQSRQLRLIAASAPPLLRMCSADMYRVIADIDELYRSLGDDSGRRRGGPATRALGGRALRAALQALCGASREWARLDRSELFLLLALANLEMLRAASGSIASVALYHHFEVREFVASPAIHRMLGDLMRAACLMYTSTLRNVAPPARRRMVAEDSRRLVLLASLATASVRESARILLSSLIDAFPALLMTGTALPRLWSVMDLLESGTTTPTPRHLRRRAQGGDEAGVIAGGVLSEERQAQSRALAELATRWVNCGQQKVPLLLFDVAVAFITRQQLGGAGQQLAGSRLAATATMPGAELELSDVRTMGQTAMRPSVAQTLVQYSAAYTWLSSALRDGRTTGAALTITESALRQLELALEACRQRGSAMTLGSLSGTPSLAFQPMLRPGTPVSRHARLEAAEELSSSLFRVVAVLSNAELRTPTATALLLRSLVGGPVQTFDSRCIMAATFAWRRLLANARERFTCAVLQELVRAMEWTVTQRLGLFDGMRPSQVQRVQCGDDDADRSSDSSRPSATDYSTNSPHTILFAFLADVYVDEEAPMAQEETVLPLLYTLAATMLQDASRFSLKDASFAETMRCMLLVGTLCRQLSATNVRRLRGAAMPVLPASAVALLRQRWYAVLLQWFRKTPPSWYFARDPALGQREMRVLQALLNLLAEEHNAVGRNAHGFAVLRNAELPPLQRPPVAERAEAGDAAVPADGAARKWLAQEQARLQRALALLQVLVRHELTRLEVWQNPRRTMRLSEAGLDATTRHTHAEWRVLLDTAAAEDAAVLVAMVTRFASEPVVRQLATEHVVRSPEKFAHLPDAVSLYLTQEVLRAGSPRLALFAACDVVQALCYLGEYYAAFPQVVAYATQSLLAQPSECLIFYLPQLLQVLAYDQSGCIAAFLCAMCRKSAMFCHQLLWTLRTEAGRVDENDKDDDEGRNKSRSAGKGQESSARKGSRHDDAARVMTPLVARCRALQSTLLDEVAARPEAEAFLRAEFTYIDRITALSGELMRYDKPRRKSELRACLQDTATYGAPLREHHIYLPTDPHYRIVDLVPHTAGAMQSAAKCPILVQFRCVPRGVEDMGGASAPRTSSSSAPMMMTMVGSPAHDVRPDHRAVADRSNVARVAGESTAVGASTTVSAPPPASSTVLKACIFKMGDDCRQDQLSLQLIGLMQRILTVADVPFFLYPYRVVTTDKGCGVIECVPRSMSRNEIGQLVESNVAEYFIQTYGHPESTRFHRARENFVRSMASYSVASYILNIKDRHNGNIMIDADGHVVHIDFGFLFDTSPGGDINFESSPFKLTTEMIQLIGHDVGSKSNLRSPSLAHALVDEASYVAFKVLINRCFLAVRQYGREICILVELMLHSGLPCFKPHKTVADLAARLALDMTEAEAADLMRRRIHESRENVRTVLYDTYQRVAEGIEM